MKSFVRVNPGNSVDAFCEHYVMQSCLLHGSVLFARVLHVAYILVGVCMYVFVTDESVRLKAK